MIGVPAPTKAAAITKPRTRDYLSYSAITTYQGCPLRYYFRYIAGLPERTVSASLVFGSAIHRAVEHHFTELLVGNGPPTLDALVGEYDRHWQGVDQQSVRFGKEEGADSLGGLAAKVLSRFQTSSVAVPDGHIVGIEEELRGPVVSGCPDILGRIDLLVETADELIVTDLKSSRSRWSREQAEDSAGQLLLYHELVRSLVPRKRVRLRFAVLTKSKAPAIDLHEIPSEPGAIDRTKRIVERVWRAIEKEIYFPAPSAMQCPSCSFRKQCRAWPSRTFDRTEGVL